MARKPKAIAALDLRSLGDSLERGDLSVLDRTVTLDLRSAGREDFQAVLELLRYKSFSHQLNRGELDLPHVLGLRSKIDAGRFEDVLDDRGSEKVRSADLELEKARALAFLGRYTEMRPLLEALARRPELSSTTRGVAYQLLGHSHLEQSRFDEALYCLETAYDLAAGLGNTLGMVAALLFLAKLDSFHGRHDVADRQLGQAFSLLAGGAVNFRWLLGFYRTSSQCRFLRGDALAVEFGVAGVLLARELGDELYAARGIAELALMQRGAAAGFVDAQARELLERASARDSELRQWRQAIDSPSDLRDPPLTLRRFLEARALPERMGRVIRYADSLRLAWIFDAVHSRWIDLNGGAWQELSLERPNGRLVAILQDCPQGIPLSEAFSRTWRSKWNPDLHKSVLEVAISRLNRTLGAMKIARKTNVLRMEGDGLLIREP